MHSSATTRLHWTETVIALIALSEIITLSFTRSMKSESNFWVLDRIYEDSIVTSLDSIIAIQISR